MMILHKLASNNKSSRVREKSRPRKSSSAGAYREHSNEKTTQTIFKKGEQKHPQSLHISGENVKGGKQRESETRKSNRSHKEDDPGEEIHNKGHKTDTKNASRRAPEGERCDAPRLVGERPSSESST
ncbi:hypothetical protein NPIL_531401 [Nephila pilipes]|uniref:Uncharacterized protein n=1 Tax=Nephila pilipes TaxID=299642 RepID=A0A8X6URI0_NEPPI|nr:hypothetical protein NPIL_531401 [Nephila pilipes]